MRRLLIDRPSVSSDGYISHANAHDLARLRIDHPHARLIESDGHLVLRDTLSPTERLLALALAQGVTIRRKPDGSFS